MTLASAAQKSLATWREMVASRDLAGLEAIVAPDAVFRSPVAYPPYPGREAVCLVLRAADAVFQDFVYHREFVSGPNDVALSQEFEVMVRPATGLMALGAAMQARLGAAGKKLKGGERK